METQLKRREILKTGMAAAIIGGLGVSTTTSSAETMDQAILQKAYDNGFQFEKDYHGCAQCVVGAVYTLFPEMRSEDIFRAANAQGGGDCLKTLFQSEK